MLVAGSALAANPQQAPTTAAAPMEKALKVAMTPGEGQKRLASMVGTFDVRIRTWVTPASAPVETHGTSVNVWVLGGRYVQAMLAAEIAGEPFSGIGYMAFDNVSRKYQATWMDTGSTAMTWYEGNLDPSGKSALMKATVVNPLTAQPSPVELHLTIEPNGDHVTEVWGLGADARMVKLVELAYTRTKH